MPHVTVGVARWRTLTAQWPLVSSIGQYLKPFTGNGDASIWVKNSLEWVENPRTNKPKIYIIFFYTRNTQMLIVFWFFIFKSMYAFKIPLSKWIPWKLRCDPSFEQDWISFRRCLDPIWVTFTQGFWRIRWRYEKFKTTTMTTDQGIISIRKAKNYLIFVTITQIKKI